MMYSLTLGMFDLGYCEVQIMIRLGKNSKTV